MSAPITFPRKSVAVLSLAAAAALLAGCTVYEHDHHDHEHDRVVVEEHRDYRPVPPPRRRRPPPRPAREECWEPPPSQDVTHRQSRAEIANGQRTHDRLHMATCIRFAAGHQRPPREIGRSRATECIVLKLNTPC